MSSFSIFVSSSDSYSDIWDVFFDMFKKMWPEYNGQIYLQTQEKDYQHEGLNIVCTKVGKIQGFGETLRTGLDKIKDDNFLFIMIDYLFMGKVDNQKMENYYTFFKTHDVDSLRLIEEKFTNFKDTENVAIKQCLPPAPHRLFSYQLAFWRKDIFKLMALPHETPWSSEYYGDKRAHLLHLKLYSIKDNGLMPIIYDARGCLHRGKWLDNAVEFLQKEHYNVDFSKRGYYDNDYQKSYWAVSWMIKRDGLKGSYWDLLLRKLRLR